MGISVLSFLHESPFHRRRLRRGLTTLVVDEVSHLLRHHNGGHFLIRRWNRGLGIYLSAGAGYRTRLGKEKNHSVAIRLALRCGCGGSVILFPLFKASPSPAAFRVFPSRPLLPLSCDLSWQSPFQSGWNRIYSCRCGKRHRFTPSVSWRTFLDNSLA